MSLVITRKTYQTILVDGNKMEVQLGDLPAFPGKQLIDVTARSSEFKEFITIIEDE